MKMNTYTAKTQFVAGSQYNIRGQWYVVFPDGSDREACANKATAYSIRDAWNAKHARKGRVAPSADAMQAKPAHACTWRELVDRLATITDELDQWGLVTMSHVDSYRWDVSTGQFWSMVSRLGALDGLATARADAMLSVGHSTDSADVQALRMYACSVSDALDRVLEGAGASMFRAMALMPTT
jgi:hypothetical protein